jgi:hypothetical protein
MIAVLATLSRDGTDCADRFRVSTLLVEIQIERQDIHHGLADNAQYRAALMCLDQCPDFGDWKASRSRDTCGLVEGGFSGSHT